MTHHTGGQENMGTQAGMGGQGTYPVDNLTYDLISTLHTKLEGLQVYQKYMKDAKGEERQLFEELQRQDSDAAKKLMDHLSKRMQKGGGMH